MEGGGKRHHHRHVLAVLVLVSCLAWPTVVAPGPPAQGCEDGQGYFWPATHKCVKVFNEAKTWDEAHEFCTNDDKDLLEIYNIEENEFISGIIQRTEGGDGDYWIGLNDIDEEGTFDWSFPWSNSEFTNWFGDEPNDGKGDEDCVHISASRNYRWNDRNCDKLTSFACAYYPLNPALDFACPNGYDNEYDQEDRCFKVYNDDGDRKSWQDAREVCQADGGELAAITSYNLNYFFQTDLLEENPGEDFWIGLNDRTNEGQFGWLDSSNPPAFTNWKYLEPNDGKGNEDCVKIKANSNFRWNDANCDQELFFICESPRQEV